MTLSITTLSKIKRQTVYRVFETDEVPCFDFVTGEPHLLEPGAYVLLGAVEGFSSRVLLSSSDGEIYEVSRHVIKTLQAA